MIKYNLTPSLILFYGSLLLPYLLDIIPQHSAGYYDTGLLFWYFVALITLAISSLIVAIDIVRLHGIFKGFIYPIAAVAAVIFYFYSLGYRILIRERIAFYLQKRELEIHIFQLNQRGYTTDKQISTNYSSPEDSTWYSKLPSGIILCTTELEASVYSAGYAYSPKDEKPLSGEYYVWHKLATHWYRWKRGEG